MGKTDFDLLKLLTPTSEKAAAAAQVTQKAKSRQERIARTRF